MTVARALMAFAMLGYAVIALVAAAIVHAVYSRFAIAAFDGWLLLMLARTRLDRAITT